MNVSNHYKFNENKSEERISKILNSKNHYDYIKTVPSNDKLTLNNGYYVNIAAIFIDIVGSSKMTNNHKRPTLAKIYRCFISESIAILQSFKNCKDININGDCVWGIFEINNCDELIEISIKITNLVDKINLILRKKGYTQIKIGIGIDYGKALLIKAGYKGGLNDTIWMGDVVNNACHLCNNANRNNRSDILISKNIFNKINRYLFLFKKVNETCYEIDSRKFNKISKKEKNIC